LRVSVLSYGTWVSFSNQLDEGQAYDIMRAAYDAGCNFFDTAEVYAEGKAEIQMAKVLQRFWKDGVKREELVISTKVYWGSPFYAEGKALKHNLLGLSRKHIVEGTRACLKRLELDYVDIVFAHRPDSEVPMEEIVRAFNFLIDQGLTFYWGTSEWSASEVREAYEVAKRLNLVGPSAEQPQYNLLHREKLERDYLKLFADEGLGTTIWSPLASGLLSGKYNKDFKGQKGTRLGDEEAGSGYKWLGEKLRNGELLVDIKTVDQLFEILDGLKPIAQKLDCSMSQLGLAWAAKNPHVSTVITGSTKVEQVKENFQALKVLPKLTPEIMAEIDKITGTAPKQPQYYAAV